MIGSDVQSLRSHSIEDISRQIDAEKSLPPEKQLSATSQEKLKTELSLFKGQSVIKIRGAEPEIRVIGVHLQNYLENTWNKLLRNRDIEKGIAIVHTKDPTSPLQNPEGDVADVFLEKLAPAVRDCPDAIKTITRRTESVRQLIRIGSDVQFKFYVAFAKGGLDRAQHTYASEANNKAENPNLVSCELSHEAGAFGPDEIGATYVMKTKDGQHLMLSLKSDQVKDAEPDDSKAKDAPQLKEWTYWFDDLKQPDVKQRYDHIHDFLEQGGLKITLP